MESASSRAASAAACSCESIARVPIRIPASRRCDGCVSASNRSRSSSSVSSTDSPSARWACASCASASIARRESPSAANAEAAARSPLLAAGQSPRASCARAVQEGAGPIRALLRRDFVERVGRGLVAPLAPALRHVGVLAVATADPAAGVVDRPLGVGVDQQERKMPVGVSLAIDVVRPLASPCARSAASTAAS